MKFSKYHGLGNDFIIVDRLEIDVSSAVALCSRHRGIGADGILAMSARADGSHEMVVYNADGSIAEMCGNGLRCAAAYLKRNQMVSQDIAIIHTGAGPLTVWYERDLVTASLGQIHDSGEASIEVDGQTITGRHLSAGNPHFVIFDQTIKEQRHTLGPLIEKHPYFPDGANVSFATVEDNASVSLIVWERGCGFTQACGTGAGATATAAWLLGKVNTGPVVVTLPGGALTLSQNLNEVLMTGPAQHVFDGVWPNAL